MSERSELRPEKNFHSRTEATAFSNPEQLHFECLTLPAFPRTINMSRRLTMKKYILIVCSIFIFGSSVLPVFAQSLSSGTANGININDKVVNGDIITSTTNGYKRANSPYDPQLFGAVS